MLCAICLVLTIPADAAAILPYNYDPVDYIQDISLAGDTKTINYNFSSVESGFFIWDSQSNETYTFNDQFEVVLYSDQVHPYTIQYFPFGQPFNPSNYHLKQPAHGCVYVGDILPNSDISYDFTFWLTLHWDNHYGYPCELGVHFYHYLDLYNADGEYLETVQLSYELRKYELDNIQNALEIRDAVNFKGTFPAKAAYVRPRIRYYCGAASGSACSTDVTISGHGGSAVLSVDINTVLENSNQMQAIKDKLNDLNDSIGNVGDKLDGTNDRLDDIISGGEAGDSLDSAGDRLDDANDHTSGSMNDVSQSEDNLMQDAQDKLDDLDDLGILSGVGDFSDSISFVSGYLSRIFYGIEDWSIVLTLPLFLGIVMFICSHSAGVTRVFRSSSSAEDDVAAQRSAYMKDHIARGSPSESYYVYQETLW